jgi:hypothetical protein
VHLKDGTLLSTANSCLQSCMMVSNANEFRDRGKQLLALHNHDVGSNAIGPTTVEFA